LGAAPYLLKEEDVFMFLYEPASRLFALGLILLPDAAILGVLA
jgi:hypothetical protein